MQAEGTGLLTLQRRFMAALLEPIYGDSRTHSDLPPREGEVSTEFHTTAQDLITPSATLLPWERLELYHRQYWYRLLDSLAEDFPALRRFLGEKAFWGLLESYLEKYPPRDLNLRHLGNGLADFIAGKNDPVAHAKHAEDLARLEYAVCLIFEAGEHPPLTATELPSAQIALQPHVHLLALHTPALAFWRTRKPRPVRAPYATPHFFLVAYRQDLRIRVEAIPKAAFVLLSALASQHSLEKAMAEAASIPRLLGPQDAPKIQGWFRTWFERGWIRKA